MKYLLDTHAFIWFITDDQKMSTEAMAAIVNRQNDVFLSQVSIWEMSIKLSIGKLQLVTPLNMLINEYLQLKHFRLLDIKNEHLFAVQHLPFHHRDPFDRLLASQCLIEKMGFISCDVIMDSYKVNRIW